MPLERYLKIKNVFKKVGQALKSQNPEAFSKINLLVILPLQQFLTFQLEIS